MGKFKVGDRVRRINDNFGLLRVGDEVIVEYCDSAEVRVENDSHRYMASCFELVSPVWVPKVGDRVECVRSYNGSFTAGKEYVVRYFDPSEPRIGVVADDKGAENGHNAKYFAKPATPTIEPGRYYKTRDGRKVGPMKEDDSFECSAFIETDNDGRGWPTSGKGLNRASGDDLIAEWQEPAVVKAKYAGEQPASNDNGPLSALIGKYFTAKVKVPAAKFKVGDRVRHVRIHRCSNGEIVGLDEFGYRVNWHNDLGTCTDPADVLELIKTTTTPAIVAMIENGTPKPSATPKVHATEDDATAEALRLANLYKGQEFGVFVYATSTTVAKPVYDHEWKRLAADGQKINAIKALKDLTGLQLKPAKDAVEYFLEHAA